jgi:flagellar P-ring protein precursor FlgI
MLKRLALACILLSFSMAAIAQTRIKDIASVQGARGNQLVGYGLVVGLDGSGDSNSTLFTAQSVVSMLQRLGSAPPPGIIKVKNVAAVIVTAELPPFAKNGSRIDVTVSSLGDAKSLQGGTLLQTPLQAGGDGAVYAVAQGSLSIGGFNVSAGGGVAQKNHVSAGRIPRGAIVEKEVETSITDGSSVSIVLRDPDFTTASRVAEAINAKFPAANASPADPSKVRISVPESSRSSLIGFLAAIEALSVTPDSTAKIIINERTGTVMIGGDVRIRPCAIAHGSIQIRIESTPIIAMPEPLTKDVKPVVTSQKEVSVKESPGRVAAIPAIADVDQLQKALNALRVTPRDLIAILQVMRTGGYINADIEVQ